MADRLGLDPARIERLRSPERLEYFDPDRIWDVLNPAPDCTLIDIGAGVGFIALPFARRYPAAKVHGCDILDGMIDLLREDAAAQGLGNVEGIVMTPNAVDLPDGVADVVVMAQLHHELDAPEPLLASRILRVARTPRMRASANSWRKVSSISWPKRIRWSLA